MYLWETVLIDPSFPSFLQDKTPTFADNHKKLMDMGFPVRPLIVQSRVPAGRVKTCDLFH